MANAAQDRTQRAVELTEAVLGYLSENPQAMETLEGIAEWWMMRQRLRVDLGLLDEVLRRLTEQGLLQADGVGEFTRYRLKT